MTKAKTSTGVLDFSVLKILKANQGIIFLDEEMVKAYVDLKSLCRPKLMNTHVGTMVSRAKRKPLWV